MDHIHISVRACPIFQVFEGNVDSYAVKHLYLDKPVVARFIKFHTVHWHKHPSMRVEIIGCQGNVFGMVLSRDCNMGSIQTATFRALSKCVCVCVCVYECVFVCVFGIIVSVYLPGFRS